MGAPTTPRYSGQVLTFSFLCLFRNSFYLCAFASLREFFLVFFFAFFALFLDRHSLGDVGRGYSIFSLRDTPGLVHRCELAIAY